MKKVSLLNLDVHCFEKMVILFVFAKPFRPSCIFSARPEPTPPWLNPKPSSGFSD
jgi:hypothetical protein